VIEANVRTGDRLLKGVEGVEIIDFIRAAMERQKGRGPVIDKIVTEGAINAVAQAVPRLRQEIDDVESGCEGNPVLRDQFEPRAIRQETHNPLPQGGRVQGSLRRLIDRRHAARRQLVCPGRQDAVSALAHR
jgi:hypothetical protein